jgi:tRNA(adenine34) deaminase
MQAITSAAHALGGKYLIDCTLYVTLEPCTMCAGALAWSQISSVVFGASDLKKGFTLLEKNVLHPKTTIVKGVLAQDCEKLLKDFFILKRK